MSSEWRGHASPTSLGDEESLSAYAYSHSASPLATPVMNHSSRATGTGTGTASGPQSAHRNSRMMGAAAHEILSSGHGHHKPGGAPPLSPAATNHVSALARVSTPSNGAPGLFIDANADEPPLSSHGPSTPSISDKLRSLKLKSRAGRTPSMASGSSLGFHPPPPATAGPAGSAHNVNNFPMPSGPHSAHVHGGGQGQGLAQINSRAASAFVRRQAPPPPSLSHAADELDQHLDGFDGASPQKGGGGAHNQRPSSNLAHYPPHGSLTPSAAMMRGSPFGDRDRDRERDRERERERERERDRESGGEISTNSSYESVGHTNSAAMGAGLNSLRGGARRRPAPMSAASTTKESTLTTTSSMGFHSQSHNNMPSSPSSNNSNSSSSAFSNPPSVYSSLNAPYETQQGGRGYSSVSPQPDQSGAHNLAAPVRRPRFTSEPGPPAPHQQQQHHQQQQQHMKMELASPHGTLTTPFGAERARAHAAQSSSSSSSAAAVSATGNYHHTHHNSIISHPHPHQQRGGGGGGGYGGHGHPATPSGSSSASNFSAQFASLMDDAADDDGHDSLAISPAPYSAAFESRAYSDNGGNGGNGNGRAPLHRSPSQLARSPSTTPAKDPYSAYDDRPIGGKSHSRVDFNLAHSADRDPYEHEMSAHLASSPALPAPMIPAQGSAASAKAKSHWDMTPQEAAAAGLIDYPSPPSDNSSPPPRSSPTPVKSAPATRAKALVRAAAASSRPSVSIPPSPSMAASSVPSTAMASPSSSKHRPSRIGGSLAPMGSPSSASSGGVSNSLSGGSGEEQYIQSADLQPFHAPAAEVSGVMKGMQSADWSTRFDSLTSLRRLMVHHPDLMLPHCKAIMRDLRAETNSLRSSLAKNGIMALGDAFTSLSKAVETELEHVGPALLKRAGEPSGFLRDEAHRSLLLMISHCSDRHVLPLLLNSAQTGTKIVKTMACVYLDRAVEIYGARANGSALQANKEFPRLLKMIGTFSSDAAVESRTHSKWSLIRLARIMGSEELERTLKRSLPPAHFHAVQKVLSKGMDTLVMELLAAQRENPALWALAAGSSPKETLGASGGHHVAASPTASFSSKRPSVAGAGSSSIYSDSSSPLEGGGAGDTDSKRGVSSLRRKPAASPTRAPLASPASSQGGSDQDSAWSSVRSTAAGSSNMFDLDNPEYNAPSTPVPSSSAAAAAAAAAAGSRGSTSKPRRPTLAGSGGGALGSTGSSASSASPATHHTHSSVADTERLNLVLLELSSNDWRTRMAALEKLRAFLASSPSASAHHAVKIFDQLQQRINDHHGKVNVAALQSLTQILPLTRAYLCGVLASFIPALATNLASTNPVIRTLSNSALDLVISTVVGGGSGAGAGERDYAPFTREAQSALIAPFAQVALFENIKVRPLVIEKLTSVLSVIAEAPAGSSSSGSGSLQLATFKPAIPLAYALCEEAQLAVRAPLLKCAQQLHALIGQGLWDEKVCMQFHFSAQQVAKLKMLLGC